MSITITATPKTNSVLIDLQNMQGTHEAGLKHALHRIGDTVKREARKLIKNGPKTGRMYGRHQASAPGQPPANRTGRLERSLKYKTRNHREMTIGAYADYAGYLECGTRKMKPRPFLIKAVDGTAQEAHDIILESIKREIEA